MITAAEISQMPVGRVLKRIVTDRGRNIKLRLIIPRGNNRCDDCLKVIKNIAVKTESSGGKTHLTNALNVPPTY